MSGETNKSKTWVIVSGTIDGAASSPTSLVFNACFLDNTYTFRNNAGQNYDVREGATKCNSTDPDITESGSWAFTQDGKIVIIHAQQLNPSTATFGFLEAEIVELTATSLEISFEGRDSNNNIVTYTMAFEVAP